jgi:dCMP deaminase
MNKPEWDVYFLRAAYLAATRASCPRKHVGALLVSPDKRVIATGYNGSPSGMDSCDDVGCLMIEGHCVRTLHAESNAIDFAGRTAMGAVLYCTVTPCFDCAKRIVNAGIHRVVYDQHYESRYGKSGTVPEYLRSTGIEVVQHDSPGLRLFKQKLAEMEGMELELLKTTQVEFGCGCSMPGNEAPGRCPDHGAARARE